MNLMEYNIKKTVFDEMLNYVSKIEKPTKEKINNFLDKVVNNIELQIQQ
jgi:hypothetical protein